MRNSYGKITNAGSIARFLPERATGRDERRPHLSVDPEIERERAFIISFLKELTDHAASSPAGIARVLDGVAEEVIGSIHRAMDFTTRPFQKIFGYPKPSAPNPTSLK